MAAQESPTLKWYLIWQEIDFLNTEKNVTLYQLFFDDERRNAEVETLGKLI
jgi:hypothetical protein